MKGQNTWSYQPYRPFLWETGDIYIVADVLGHRDVNTTKKHYAAITQERRKMVAEKYDVNWVTIIHPSAQIAVHVSIGKGTVVMAGAVVNACSVVGDHCIVNTNSVVEHDNIVGNYVHISPNVALGGTVHIGENTHIGIGASVSNNIDICNDCMIGAGAVVVRNISDSGTYMGVPARKRCNFNES